MQTLTIKPMFHNLHAVMEPSGLVVGIYEPNGAEGVTLKAIFPPDSTEAPVIYQCKENEVLGLVQTFYSLYWDGYHDCDLFDE